MTNTNPRDLIQQLAGLARRKHYTCEDSWYNCPQSECGSDRNPGAECDCGADEHNAKVDAIWAALSLPEPEGPTDEELNDLFWKHSCEIGDRGVGLAFEDAPALIREALARWGRPAIKPVPVSERLPGPEDCWPDGHEKAGCCWLWTSEDGLGRWEVRHRDWASEPDSEYTHWRPYYAMPTPQP